MSGLDRLKIGIAYRFRSKIYRHYPAETQILEKCTPIYEEYPGWQEDISKVRRWKDLPRNAQRYLKRLEALMETPIKIVSVGSERNQTIFI